VNSPPPKPEVILTNFFAEPTVLLVPITSRDNVKIEDTVCPNFSLKKAVLQNYLTQHNIPFSATDTKKVLYEKIKQKKSQ
jgi:hypothetical protein